VELLFRQIGVSRTYASKSTLELRQTEVRAMADRKEHSEKWRAFIFNRFLPHFWEDIRARFGATVLGILTALLVLLAHFHYGVIAGGMHGRILSIVWPYAALVVAFTVYHLARTPWLISNEQLDAIATLNKAVAQHEAIGAKLNELVREKDEDIRILQEPKRTPAEQYHYDKAKAFLDKRGPKFVGALQHLRNHGDLTYSSAGITMHTQWPPKMDRNEAIPIYEACMQEGLVTMQEIPGVHPARKIFIAPAMANALSELLYGSDELLGGLAGIRRK
jgi:hypothetical protein